MLRRVKQNAMYDEAISSMIISMIDGEGYHHDKPIIVTEGEPIQIITILDMDSSLDLLDMRAAVLLDDGDWSIYKLKTLPPRILHMYWVMNERISFENIPFTLRQYMIKHNKWDLLFF